MAHSTNLDEKSSSADSGSDSESDSVVISGFLNFFDNKNNQVRLHSAAWKSTGKTGAVDVQLPKSSTMNTSDKLCQVVS